MLVRAGHMIGSLVMALTIAGVLVHLPVTLLLGMSALVQGGALVLDLAIVVLATREFYRNYEEWFEPL